ncbi:MAG TPA: 2-phospho-L-lactate guanylyltransferase [Polyangiaceae bacterium]|nr:2-phospho-L-lactate guanylyltransferase [Polyangiaceae bacterium]
MSGRTWAVVPAKSLVRGKSRLSPALDRAARARFARTLLEHVLEVLRASGLEGILVATDGQDVSDLATSRGAAVLFDQAGGSLAAVVDRALAEVERRGATAAIVLMADLPRIEARDVVEILAALDGHDVVLARDHLGHHTNALALVPPTAMGTRFGRADSFEAHVAAARDAGLRVVVIDNDRVAFDVDLPADHRRITT